MAPIAGLGAAAQAAVQLAAAEGAELNFLAHPTNDVLSLADPGSGRQQGNCYQGKQADPVHIAFLQRCSMPMHSLTWSFLAQRA